MGVGHGEQSEHDCPASPLTADGINVRRYVFYTLLSLAVVLPVATLQGLLIIGHLPLHFYVAPVAVATAFGLLLGRLTTLRERLRITSNHFRAIADLAQEFTYLRDLDGRYLYVSPSSESLTGHPPESFYANPALMDQLVHPDDADKWQRHVHSINTGGSPESFDLRLLVRGDQVVWINHVCLAVHDAQGRQTGVRSTNLDITARKEAEARISHLADYDPLTELPNRRLLYRELQALIDASNPLTDRFALLFLDLLRFKNINDSFGHGFGDRLLQQIAGRLAGACPPNAIPARIGGDEFVMLLPDAGEPAKIEQVANLVLGAIEEPIILQGSELFVSASLGAAFFPAHGRDADTLMRHADLAMYRARSQRTRGLNIYSTRFGDETSRFVSLEHRIHKALERREFVVYYQPKVRMSDGGVVGLEALARWRHPESGLIPPADFIPVAEETGQIIELGSQVFDQVLSDLEAWRHEGVAVPVSVNVSARQFADHEFCASVCDRLEDPTCDASLIELEITEQVFLGDLAGASHRLSQLRTVGARLALDDFGTGYSSLNYLRELPINTLKIDRSFVTDLSDNRASHAILRAVIGMCQELELDTVVEGVETDAQREVLSELGCELVQGFLFHHPMSHDEVTRLLRQRQLEPVDATGGAGRP